LLFAVHIRGTRTGKSILTFGYDRLSSSSVIAQAFIETKVEEICGISKKGGIFIEVLNEM
jgi:hypothetical protein